MATAQQIQARIEAIRAARDSGVLLVRHGDTSTQFRTLDEMNAIIASLQTQLDALNGQKRRRVHYVIQCGKGL
jgi:hypothetical protein